jgi:hypothetical protein
LGARFILLDEECREGYDVPSATMVLSGFPILEKGEFGVVYDTRIYVGF